jgi:putative secretion ATPase (PEP-CTERM system associated)
MYESYYGFIQKPFNLALDQNFFFASAEHKRGLSYLQYGLHQGQGVIVVTGMPGTGKSTLVRHLLAGLTPRTYAVATLTNTNLSAEDLLQAVANHFNVYKVGDTKASLLFKLEKYFLQQHHYGRKVLLLVDEAQNLPLTSLEELRMLSNFQHDHHVLVQIMLVGQKQLQTILADSQMEQLAQRVITSYHLEPMNGEECRHYIRHRLLRVGWKGDPAFSGNALVQIYRYTQGIPRLINIFCDRALLFGALEEKHAISEEDVKAVAAELDKETAANWLRNSIADEIASLSPLPDANDKFPEEPKETKATETKRAEESEKIPVLNKVLSAPPTYTRVTPQRQPEVTVSSLAEIEASPAVPGAQSHTGRNMLVASVLVALAAGAYFLFSNESAKELLLSNISRPQPAEPLQDQRIKPTQTVTNSAPVAKVTPQLPVQAEPVVAPQLQPIVEPVPTPIVSEPKIEQPTQPVSVKEAATPTPQTTPEPPPPPAKKTSTISDLETSEILYNFIMSYQDGSLNPLIGLFTNDAVFNNSTGKQQISQKYQDIFGSTDLRQLIIENFQWKKFIYTASGKGDIRISNWPKGGASPQELIGKIEIGVVKRNGRLWIKSLTYRFE